MTAQNGLDRGESYVREPIAVPPGFAAAESKDTACGRAARWILRTRTRDLSGVFPEGGTSPGPVSGAGRLSLLAVRHRARTGRSVSGSRGIFAGA